MPIFDPAIFDGAGIFDVGLGGEPEPPTPTPTPPVAFTHRRIDPAVLGSCRVGYVRLGVYLPVFDNDLVPALLSASVPAPSNWTPSVVGSAKLGSFRLGVYIPLFEVIKENLRKKT